MNSIVDEIKKLKIEKNAIILAHYYQNSEIQDIADYVGDSYYLSKVGVDSDADVIVFCGVKFMAESAKILSPKKTVLLPNEEALCSMAVMARADEIEKMKKEYPNAKVLCYVNSSTEVKAISDVCCTSSSAMNICRNIQSDEIIFVPDKNLGSYIQEKVPEKRIILWNGFCCIHNNIIPEDVIKVKEEYGENIEVLIHPECTKEVRELGDFVGSTGQIIEYASNSDKKEFIVVTDVGILHELRKRNPTKRFYPLNMVCNNMKITTIGDVYNCLVSLSNEIYIDEGVRIKAENALRKMHELV
ncbi:quinolinate synthase NadA [Tepidibacter mesophilus]|uniref:quinolinate synthase NadA n=1 Tax=Tepidibacter mesophilus TaxID=655607 RepID=UPI002E8E48FC|nr:quinolinate synthase NadA [Tepidibacter mesophilus]